MHPDTTYQLARLRISEDQAYAARMRLAREARDGQAWSSIGSTGDSLLERLVTTLRRATRGTVRVPGAVA